MKFIWICVVGIVFLCGACKQKKEAAFADMHVYEQYTKSDTLPDLPLHASHVQVQSLDEGDVLLVTCKIPTDRMGMNDIHMWYIREFERQGWNVETYGNFGKQLFMLARSPRAWCFVEYTLQNKKHIVGKVLKQTA